MNQKHELEGSLRLGDMTVNYHADGVKAAYSVSLTLAAVINADNSATVTSKQSELITCSTDQLKSVLTRMLWDGIPSSLYINLCSEQRMPSDAELCPFHYLHKECINAQ